MNLVCRHALLITFMVTGSFGCMVATAQNNQRFFTGDNTNAGEFNKIAKYVRRATRDLDNRPPAFSIKQYAPIPGQQGNQGTCVAWSTAYAARTISYCVLHEITDAEKIQLATFSPNYLYYYVKTSGDKNCTMGSQIEPALKVLTERGDLLLADKIPDCIASIDTTTYSKAKDYVIKAYTSLTNLFGGITKEELITMKKSISEKKPVIFSLKCLNSFFNVGADGVWNIGEQDESVGNHAICIVGYDDNKLGGAFEVINSWGQGWGNKGFGWITYDQVTKYGSYALQLMDREVYAGNQQRGFSPPQIKGSLDLVVTNDFGNDISTMPVVKTSIEVSSTGGGNNPGFTIYRIVENYPAGYKFKIKFVTNSPVFVYIFSLDDQQVVSTLFPPSAGNISPAINSTDATVYLPSESKHYKLNDDANRDRIGVLYSKSPIDFDYLKSRIVSAPADMYQVIQSLYGNRLIPPNKINFNDNRISFSSIAGEQELVCFFIDLHRK